MELVSTIQLCHGALLARLITFQAAPMAVVLAIDGHLAAVLRQAADVYSALNASERVATPDQGSLLLTKWVSCTTCKSAAAS